MANERKICVILGSASVEGDCIPEDLCAKDAYLICADGGVDTAARLGLHPDLIVGDFDSLEGELPQDVETIHLPVEKDETDLLYGVKEGFRRGYNQFVLLALLYCGQRRPGRAGRWQDAGVCAEQRPPGVYGFKGLHPVGFSLWRRYLPCDL